MKPQNERDLKAAFLNCINKLAWDKGKLLDRYADALNSGLENADPQLKSFKAFICSWTPASDVKDFPEEAFLRYVKNCTVDTGKTVRFHFFSGLFFTESIDTEE